MVLTASTMLSLGTPAPEFTLPDVITGQAVSLASFAKKKGLLVMFICNHCPYVVHIKEELRRLSDDYAGSDIGMVAISSNDAGNYPEDAPAKLKQMALDLDFKFPLCIDETQEVAKRYTAACTPDFFLFDKDNKLVYRGQLDDSRPGNNKPLTGTDLRAAMNALQNDQPVNPDQKPSAGCNIKWKSGNEPAYFKL